MSTIPADLRYTNDHEWLREQGNACVVGITLFAVEQLGDITLVDLPKAGDRVTRGERFGTIESVKSVSDLYAPITGTVSKVNADLGSSPELVNTDPYGKAWMVEIEPSDRGELTGLMNADAYAKHIA
ncbi:MAG: glycine cleavage system protein GcvH [Kofleriaceae bacterium]|nr:glycine cleavage system protein GcvH [Kofleriaceae bacterium]MBP9207344.1 glycine cleavage system protein GcvH [Kofleriaceae bacterium]